MLTVEPLPPWAKDAVVVHNDVTFSFLDRLRLLFGYRLTLKAITYCAKEPGRVETLSEVHVWHFRPLPKGWGYAEISERRADGKAGEGKERG